jgi:hypothetical protein
MRYKTKGPGAEKKVEYNISAYKFEEVYIKLSDVFGTNPVVIGGRAVNLLCDKNTRPTHDIDVVVPVNPTSKKDSLLKKDFMLKYDNSRKNVIGLTYLDKEGLSLKGGEQPLTVDFYYSRSLNGLTIEEIARNVKTVMVEKTPVTIADQKIMLLLKYDAGREKDNKDFEHILDKFYGGNIYAFFEDEGKFLDALLSSHISDGKKMNRLLAEYYYYKEGQKSLIRN